MTEWVKGNIPSFSQRLLLRDTFKCPAVTIIATNPRYCLYTMSMLLNTHCGGGGCLKDTVTHEHILHRTEEIRGGRTSSSTPTGPMRHLFNHSVIYRKINTCAWHTHRHTHTHSGNLRFPLDKVKKKTESVSLLDLLKCFLYNLESTENKIHTNTYWLMR